MKENLEICDRQGEFKTLSGITCLDFSQTLPNKDVNCNALKFMVVFWKQTCRLKHDLEYSANDMFRILIFAVVAKTLINGCHGCTYPTDLRGQWHSTRYGTWTFTDSTFSGFSVPGFITPATFTCQESSGSLYVSL